MTRSAVIVATPRLAQLRREIERFVRMARWRSEFSAQPRRRSERRYHRSWPLVLSLGPDSEDPDIAAALHNASPQGIGFLCVHRIPVGTVVYLKLFWAEMGCPRIPAIVRHHTLVRGGYLIGCRFAVPHAVTRRQACLGAAS